MLPIFNIGVSQLLLKTRVILKNKMVDYQVLLVKYLQGTQMYEVKEKRRNEYKKPTTRVTAGEGGANKIGNSPEHTQTVTGEGLLVGLDLGAELRGHRDYAVAQHHLGTAVDDALGGSLHYNKALTVGLSLLLHDMNLPVTTQATKTNKMSLIGTVLTHLAGENIHESPN